MGELLSPQENYGTDPLELFFNGSWSGSESSTESPNTGNIASPTSAENEHDGSSILGPTANGGDIAAGEETALAVTADDKIEDGDVRENDAVDDTAIDNKSTASPVTQDEAANNNSDPAEEPVTGIVPSTPSPKTAVLQMKGDDVASELDNKVALSSESASEPKESDASVASDYQQKDSEPLRENYDDCSGGGDFDQAAVLYGSNSEETTNESTETESGNDTEDEDQPIRKRKSSRLSSIAATAKKAKASQASSSSKKTAPKAKATTTKKDRRSRRKTTNPKQRLPLTLDGYWEIEQMLEHRVRNNVDEYLVKWEGFDEDENSWEPADNLSELALAEAKKFKKKKNTA